MKPYWKKIAFSFVVMMVFFVSQAVLVQATSHSGGISPLSIGPGPAGTPASGTPAGGAPSGVAPVAPAPTGTAPAPAADDSLIATQNFYTGEYVKDKKEKLTLQKLYDELLPNTAKWATGLLAAIAVFMLIWAGIQFLTAGGEMEKVAAAWKITLYVFAGVIVMMLAYAIVYLFIGLFS